jgi:hypothetical protein
MKVLRGKRKKVDRVELLRMLENPDIEEAILNKLEALKIEYKDVLKPAHFTGPITGETDGAIRMDNFNPLYVDDTRLFDFFRFLQDNPHYKEEVLAEYNGLARRFFEQS